VIAASKGAFGSSLDYMERTRVALVTHGIRDPYLEALAVKVTALRRA
jgi:cation transport regulator ChaC